MKNKNSKDYSKYLVEYPYDKKLIAKKFKEENKSVKIRRQECNKKNSNARTTNSEYFSESLQKTIKFYLSKSKFNGDEVKTLMGISYATLALLYENRENKSFDFKFIYDLCFVLNVPMMDFVEKFEGGLVRFV